MARRRKKDELPKVEASVQSPTAQRLRRFRVVTWEDGSERAERCVRRQSRYDDQAYSDFYGVQPELAVSRNTRDVASVLGELLGTLKLEVSEMAPELLADTWKRAAGPVLGLRSQLVSVVKGVATVRTSHPVVHRELQMMQRALLAALKREMGDASTVTSLRVVRG